MLECIQCGNVQLTAGKCDQCGGALIPALSKEAAAEELITRLQHHGIQYSAEEQERIKQHLYEAY